MSDPSSLVWCSACDHTFPSQVLGADITSDSGEIPPLHITEECPNCCAAVTIVRTSESFTLAEGPIRLRELLQPEGVTAEDYRRLADALLEAANSRTGGEVRVGALDAAAAADRVPIFGPLAQWIRDHPQTSQWLVTTLIGVLTLVLSRFPASSSTPTPPTNPPSVEAPPGAPTPEQVQQWIRDAIADHERAERERSSGPRAGDDSSHDGGSVGAGSRDEPRPP